MKNKVWMILCLIICCNLQNNYACDICGCNISGHGVGLLNAYNANQMAFRYNLNQFKSPVNSSSRISDQFQNFELAIQYQFTDRLSLRASLLYQVNLRNLKGAHQQLEGFGDARLQLVNSFLRDYELSKSASINLELGFGALLPTGRFDKNIHQLELPENFNPGKGSWGLSIHPQMILNYKNAGILCAASYQHFFTSRSGYNYGNQFSIQGLIFADIQVFQNINWIPFAGVHSEWAQKDRYENRIEVHGTGAQGAFVLAGMNFKIVNLMAGISTAFPFSQNYSDGETRAGNKLSCQLSYFF